MRLNERIEIMIQGIEYKVTTTKGKDFFLSFLHKDKDKLVVDGVLNEDLLDILVHRLEDQNSKKSDRFNNKTLFFLREAKRLLEERRFFYRNFKLKQKLLNHE